MADFAKIVGLDLFPNFKHLTEAARIADNFRHIGEMAERMTRICEPIAKWQEAFKYVQVLRLDRD